MAQIKLLKIGSTGLPTEMSTSADDITLASFTVNGGPVLSGTGLDMNTQSVTDAGGYAVTTPASQGITQTAGTLAFDNIVGKERSNTMTTASDILFPVVTDTAGQVDILRLPAIAGTPTATPTTSGEGFLLWDSVNDRLVAWTGAQWTSAIATASTAATVIDSATFTADTAGVSIRNAVYVSAANKVLAATNTAESTARVIGFATNTAASAAAVNVQYDGVLGGFTGLTAGARQYLGTAGAITATLPTGAGTEIIQVGYAASTTQLKIQIQHIGVLS